MKTLILFLLCCFLSFHLLFARKYTPSPHSRPTPTPTPVIEAPKPVPLTLPLNIDLIPINASVVKNAEGKDQYYVPFWMSQGCVSVKEYCAFLNAVAATGDPYLLYKPQMTVDTRAACITCDYDATTHIFHFSAIRGMRKLPERRDENQEPLYVPIEDLPMTFVTVFDAARFCNWMHNGQPTAPEGPSTTESGAYSLNFPENPFTHKKNRIDANISLNAGATWKLPSPDQWAQFLQFYSIFDRDKEYYQWVDHRIQWSGYPAEGGSLATQGTLPINDATKMNLPGTGKRTLFPDTPLFDCGFRIIKIGDEGI